jgi:hypothetical protein
MVTLPQAQNIMRGVVVGATATAIAALLAIAIISMLRKVS